MKNILFPILFALTAAIGNAMFALGQKQSSATQNGLLFVGISAAIAVSFALILSPVSGDVNAAHLLKENWKALLLSGTGLFLTYLGFNLLYSRYGVSQYVLYAVLSIITTTIVIGILWLKEPVTLYHKIAVSLAVISVVIFSIGQSKM